MRTGTITDADWTTTRTFSFSDRRRIATVLGTYRKALSKEIPWAQARLQMQIGHARATRKNVHFFQIVEGELPACVGAERL